MTITQLAPRIKNQSFFNKKNHCQSAIVCCKQAQDMSLVN